MNIVKNIQKYIKINTLLWTLAGSLLVFILLVGGYLGVSTWKKTQDEKNAKAAEVLLQEVATRTYEIAGRLVSQVETLSKSPVDPEVWKQIISKVDTVIPREIAYYYADDHAVLNMVRNSQDEYITSIKEVSSRAMPLFQRAQTLRVGEIYITPARQSLQCDYRHCSQDEGEIFAYVTPVYKDEQLQGALVVAYDVEIFNNALLKIKLPDTFFVVNAQGYYRWHNDYSKILEAKKHLASSFFVDFDKEAANEILNPAGSRMVSLEPWKKAYIYPVSPATQMLRDGELKNVPAPVTAPENYYFIYGFIK